MGREEIKLSCFDEYKYSARQHVGSCDLKPTRIELSIHHFSCSTRMDLMSVL